MKAFVQLGKLGDILSILPVLHYQAILDRTKTPLVVSREYASLLDGVSYVEPIIFKGASDDLRGALVFAKKKYSHVINLQTHGNLPTIHTMPSFQLDQYARCGLVNKFQDLPLIFDRRDPAREFELHSKYTGKLPLILFADHSQSSPFIQKEELAKILREAFPGHTVLRLSEVRCAKFYDMLGLYEKAKCLVTVETSHLHLSKASKIPVLAMAADGWRGSAYSDRFRFYMRYGEWSARKLELLQAVRDCVEEKPVLEFTDVSTGSYGYNLSILDMGSFSLTAYRAHTRGDWRTELFMNGERMAVDDSLKEFSIEDPRLFAYKNRMYCAYVVSTTKGGFFRSYMAYGQIDGEYLNHIRVNIPGNDHNSELQKNWVPFVHENALYFIYGINGENQIVLQVDGDKVVSRHNSTAPKWPYGQIRGGTVLAFKDRLLRFFHSRVTYPDKTLRYYVGVSVLDSKPPFQTLKVCSRPVLAGTELFVPGAKFWKPNVVFPLGAMVSGDEKITLSFGVNDSRCCTVELSESDLHL